MQFTLFQPKHHVSLLRQFAGVGHNNHALVLFVGALFQDFRDVLRSILIQIARVTAEIKMQEKAEEIL